MGGVHNLCLPVSSLGVVAWELLVCEGAEAIDGVAVLQKVGNPQCYVFCWKVKSPNLCIHTRGSGGRSPLEFF